MEQIYQEFDQYDFEDDINFQSGLPLILQSRSHENKSKEEIDQIIKKAKWFYFSK
ncbi:9691_t:CDS:2 [Diversispora eburnea]|uniref:9691_t:CDS:1 n=1 Tax=Diversispora eburnea TaxID=1213867 RepID=A0A9N8WMP1_9GLOM|nr:9691_t:CDS:2 [Diversispora eburnea]